MRQFFNGVLPVALLFGCACTEPDRSSDRSSNYTINVLQQWESVLTSIVEAKADDPAKYQSVAAALESWKKMRLVNELEATGLHTDHAGKPLLWDCKPTREGLVAKIASTTGRTASGKMDFWVRMEFANYKKKSVSYGFK